MPGIWGHNLKNSLDNSTSPHLSQWVTLLVSIQCDGSCSRWGHWGWGSHPPQEPFKDVPQDQVLPAEVQLELGTQRVFPNSFIQDSDTFSRHKSKTAALPVSGWNTDESNAQRSHLVSLALCASHWPGVGCSLTLLTPPPEWQEGHNWNYLPRRKFPLENVRSNLKVHCQLSHQWLE